jgi:ABC-type Fe3+ transport system permease subunit
MKPADVLRWIEEIAALILLIPVALAFLYLRRRSQGNAGFTDRDWRFLFGHPREKVLSLQLWIKFLALLFAVVLIGFGLGLLSLTSQRWLVHKRLATHSRGGFPHYAEMVTLRVVTSSSGLPIELARRVSPRLLC